MTENAAGGEGLRAKRPRLAGLVVGLVALAGVIAFVFHVGDIGAFAEKAKEAAPAPIALAILAQVFAFLAQAFVWALVLGKHDASVSRVALVNLSIGKLFADQAVPSAGISGGVFLIHALSRRGVSAAAAFTTFVFGAGSSIAAFLIFASGALAYVTLAGGAVRGLSINLTDMHYVLIASFLAMLVIAAFYAVSSGATPVRSQTLKKAGDMARSALRMVIVERGLFAQCMLLQGTARLFDCLTLWFVFRAIGDDISFPASVAAVSLAALAATVAPTPMGLGSFEAGMTAALAALGLAVEPALAGGLIYRGLSLGLPLAVGFFIVQRELLRK